MRRSERGTTRGEAAEADVPRTADEKASAAEADEAVANLFKGDGPSMGKGYERITARVFSIDEWTEYEELEKDLKLGEVAHRAEYSTLVDSLERAEDNSRRAHRLFVNAKVALEAFEIDAQVIESDMRAQALAKLEDAKATGQMKKTITNDDVTAQMAAMFPDQWRAAAQRRAKAKQSVAHLEHLVDVWKARSRTLNTMVQTSRK